MLHCISMSMYINVFFICPPDGEKSFTVHVFKADTKFCYFHSLFFLLLQQLLRLCISNWFSVKARVIMSFIRKHLYTTEKDIVILVLNELFSYRRFFTMQKVAMPPMSIDPGVYKKLCGSNVRLSTTTKYSYAPHSLVKTNVSNQQPVKVYCVISSDKSFN